jgi:UDP:flavonoid glycosyltransferase YjiC (YdhE family)
MVLATGGRVAADALGTVPDWVQVEDFVPQVAVLHQADAFVTHAGMGSSAEALWCGVPTVAVPQAVDQYGNADQLAALGVAGDPDVRRRLDTVRDDLHRNGGPGHAADAVEDLATGTW